MAKMKESLRVEKLASLSFLKEVFPFQEEENGIVVKLDDFRLEKIPFRMSESFLLGVEIGKMLVSSPKEEEIATPEKEDVAPSKKRTKKQ